MLKTILLANHDAAVRITQKNSLTQSGYEVIGEAEDVKQTVEKFKKLTPSLVIVDYNPFEFDGIKAIEDIKAIDNNVNIIISSEFGAHSGVIEAIQLGVKDWVFPLNSEQLILAVKRILG